MKKILFYLGILLFLSSFSNLGTQAFALRENIGTRIAVSNQKKSEKKKEQSNKKNNKKSNKTSNIIDEDAEIVGDISNLSIIVYSPTNMQYLFNGEYHSLAETNGKYGYRSSIILPLAFLNKSSNNELTFQFRVEQNGKIHYVKIVQKYTPELVRKGSLLIFIGKENLNQNELPQEFQDSKLQSWDSKDIYIKTSNISTITLEDRSDVEAVILFPNLLGVRSYIPILILGVVILFLSGGFLIYKKDLIKI